MILVAKELCNKLSEDSNQYANCPTCPEIKKSIDQIHRALLGEDGTGMKEGVIFELTQAKIKNRINTSWINALKPIATVTITSLTTAAIMYYFFGGSIHLMSGLIG